MALQSIRPYVNVARGKTMMKTNTAINVPAPTNGLNYRTPISQQDPKDAIVLENMVCRPYGVELRSGWAEHSIGMAGEVHSLMPHVPQEGTLFSKLFAGVDDSNIYDVTSVGTAVVDVNIPGQVRPGDFSFVNFVTEGESYLCVVSQGGGYWTYTNSGGWVQRVAGAGAGEVEFPVGDTTGLDSFVVIRSWKNRLWFIKADSGDAYFLPTGQVAGELKLFPFGPLFQHGGYLDQMASWTMDGGDGIDDKLVLMSNTGDLLVYEGTNPASAAEFRIVGRWFVGPPPSGRRYMSIYGGDLVIITSKGLTFLSELLQLGGKFHDWVESAGKINQFLGRRVAQTSGQNYWELRYLTNHQLMLVNSPDTADLTDMQIVYEVNALGFSMFRGMPMLCSSEYLGELYFGTTDGRVAKGLVGKSDGALLDATPGTDIEGSVQTAWTHLGTPANLKRFVLVQPFFISTTTPSIKIRINTDWHFSSVEGSPALPPTDASLWDLDVWGTAIWGGGQNSYSAWAGVTGLGHYVSLRMKIRGDPGTIFTNWIVVAEVGGIL